jgi:hypothetical protein
MPALKNTVLEAVNDKGVRVVYLDQRTSKWWNSRRRADDTVTFCGYYWTRRDEEGGPFRSRSAALRDAYYRFVLQREVPHVSHAQEDMDKPAKRKAKTLRMNGARP